jgi:hypothetical protein
MSPAREVWVMEIHAVGNSFLKPGVYLQAFDVDKRDARNPLETGDIVATDKLELAMKFDSMAAVMEAWKTQSTLVPRRPDGKPNRPLTAMSISPKKVS